MLLPFNITFSYPVCSGAQKILFFEYPHHHNMRFNLSINTSSGQQVLIVVYSIDSFQIMTLVSFLNNIKKKFKKI